MEAMAPTKPARPQKLTFADMRARACAKPRAVWGSVGREPLVPAACSFLPCWRILAAWAANHAKPF
jgi:hypothetical protein